MSPTLRLRRASPSTVLPVAIMLGATAMGASAERACGQLRPRPDDRWVWTGAAALVVGTALADASIRAAVRERPTGDSSGMMGAAATAGDALGTGRHLIAGMAAVYVAARLMHRRPVADAVKRIAFAYAAANVVGGTLKPAVGRHRPVGAEDQWRFRPFATRGAWHSFPSSHALHAWSIAAALDEEDLGRWPVAVGYAGATLVAWSRVRADQHWASDVAASAVLGIAAAKATRAWLREDEEGPALVLAPGPGAWRAVVRLRL